MMPLNMPRMVGRVEKVNPRKQVNLNGEILGPKVIIKEAYEGAKRGPYQHRRSSANIVKVVLSVAGIVEFKGERYTKLTDKSLLPET